MFPYVFTTLEHTVGNPFLQYIVLLIHNKFLNSRVRNTRTRCTTCQKFETHVVPEYKRRKPSRDDFETITVINREVRVFRLVDYLGEKIEPPVV